LAEITRLSFAAPDLTSFPHCQSCEGWDSLGDLVFDSGPFSFIQPTAFNGPPLTKDQSRPPFFVASGTPSCVMVVFITDSFFFGQVLPSPISRAVSPISLDFRSFFLTPLPFPPHFLHVSQRNTALTDAGQDDFRRVSDFMSCAFRSSSEFPPPSAASLQPTC